MAVIPQVATNENTAYEAYRAHLGDCLECGAVLHNRWAAAQGEQHEDDR